MSTSDEYDSPAGTNGQAAGKADESAVDKEIANQEAAWIKYAQETQRGLSDKYDDTAKTLLGLFGTVIGVFTILLAFFGLASSVHVPIALGLAAILCFIASIALLLIVIGPRGIDEINYYDSQEIWALTIRRNIADHRKLTAAIILFIIGIFIIGGSIAYSSYIPGSTVKIIVPADKVPYLQNASIPFAKNSTVSGELALVKQDDKTYTFRIANGNRVTISRDWVQALVTTK